jgi:hypothetical protein
MHDHPLIAEFLDYMWEWPLAMRAKIYGDFDQKVSLLTGENRLPEELAEPLKIAGISEMIFQHLIENTAQILSDSFYAAAADESSMRHLLTVIHWASNWGVSPPPFEAFSNSLFRHNHGYGRRVKPEQWDRWRYPGNEFFAENELVISTDVVVVNFHDYGSVGALDQAFGKRWRYIGQANKHHGLPASPLANEFTIKEHGRDGAISQYRRWLWPQLRQELDSRYYGPVTDAVAELLDMPEDAMLVCWCAPQACHGDVLKRALAMLTISRTG